MKPGERFSGWTARGWRLFGLDPAILFTLAARMSSIAGSTVTVLLIVRFLNPVEQGYYYTLLSLISLQMVFELGFSFVIQQLAAHECVDLEFGANGRVSGDPVAHARLASTLQLSLRWYTRAAAAMGLTLAPLGMIFFARHAAAGSAQIAWRGPFLTAVGASMVGLWCAPFYSFLEGCGQVRAVAAMRFGQALATSAFAWAPLLLGRGLYSPAMAIAGYVAAGLVFLARRRRLLHGLLRHAASEAAIDWSREVWPFQWRIAVSWACSYLTVQIFVPILFALRGAVEAGQMGMSLSVTGYMTILALAWTSTKITPFGRLIARREFHALDRLFLRTLVQSLAAFALLALAACCVVWLFPSVAPQLAARIVAPQLFGVLVLGAGANCVVQSLATLLRSFKSEPFLVQSLAVAALTLALSALTAARWGNAGAALSYLLATGVLGLPFAGSIFVRARRGYLAREPLAPSGANAAGTTGDGGRSHQPGCCAVGALHCLEERKMFLSGCRKAVDTLAPPLGRLYRVSRDATNRRRSIATKYGFSLAGDPAMARDGWEADEIGAFLELMETHDSVLDIGANVGFYSCLAASRGKHTVAVEPSPRNLGFLYRNLWENGFLNVEVFPLGLAAQGGIRRLYGYGGTSSFVPGWAQARQGQSSLVGLSTLDTIAAGRLGRRKLLIKMDVEGFELEVLAGARATLDLIPKPTWLVEILLRGEIVPGGVGRGFAETFQVFFRHGYRARQLDAARTEVEPADVDRWTATGFVDGGTHDFLFSAD